MLEVATDGATLRDCDIAAEQERTIKVVSKGLKASLSWRLIVDQRVALITAGTIAKTIVAPMPTAKV